VDNKKSKDNYIVIVSNISIILTKVKLVTKSLMICTILISNGLNICLLYYTTLWYLKKNKSVDLTAINYNMLFNISIYISQRIPTNYTLHNIVSTTEISHNIKMRHNYRVIYLLNNSLFKKCINVF